MTYKMKNPADNISIAEAEAFIEKLKNLGVPAGPVYLNGSSAGPEEADYVPFGSVETQPDEAYACLTFIGRDWHNVAMLKRMLGTGSLQEFQNVMDDCGMGGPAAALNIPGAAAAIERIIRGA